MQDKIGLLHMQLQMSMTACNTVTMQHLVSMFEALQLQART